METSCNVKILEPCFLYYTKRREIGLPVGFKVKEHYQPRNVIVTDKEFYGKNKRFCGLLLCLSSHVVGEAMALLSMH